MKILSLTLCMLLSAGFMSCNSTFSEPQKVQALSMASFQNEVMQASSVMVFPSESDLPFSWFVSSLHRLPDAATFARSTGHAGEAAIRLDFDAFFDRYTQIQPWMDEGQQAFASQMQHLREIFRKHSQKFAVYRVGEIQVHIYIVAVVQGRVVGLETLSIET